MNLVLTFVSELLRVSTYEVSDIQVIYLQYVLILCVATVPSGFFRSLHSSKTTHITGLK